MAKPEQSRRVVVMGVSGCGKTSVGRLLAERLGLPFAEGDDDHPEANRKKMSAGIPLQDEDRKAWLLSLKQHIARAKSNDSDLVLTCSALKRRYRDLLREADPELFFIHLQGSKDLLLDRMRKRRGHFMPPSLLDSQLADLEDLQSDEAGFAVDVRPPLDQIVETILRKAAPS